MLPELGRNGFRDEKEFLYFCNPEQIDWHIKRLRGTLNQGRMGGRVDKAAGKK